MQKRRLLLLLVCLAALTVLLVFPFAPEEPISQANFDRIQPCMTRAEVEAILHGPPGEYQTGEVELDNAASDWIFMSVWRGTVVIPWQELSNYDFQYWMGD